MVVETTNRKYYLFSETVTEAVNWLGMIKTLPASRTARLIKPSHLLYLVC